MKDILVPYLKKIISICLAILGGVMSLLQKSNYFIVLVMVFCICCNLFYIIKKKNIAKNIAQMILNGLIVWMFLAAFQYEGGIQYTYQNILTTFAKLVEMAAVLVVAVATIYNYHGFEIKNRWLDFVLGIGLNLFYAVCTGVLIEMIFNPLVGLINKQYFIIGIIAMFLIFLLVYAVTSSYKLPGLILAPLFLLFTIANQFVFLFRGTPMLLNDLRNIGTAAEVADNYVYQLNGEMIISIVCMYCLVVLLIRSLRFKKPERKRIVWYVAGLAGSTLLCVFGFQFLILKKAGAMDINFWNLSYTYEEYGTPMTLIGAYDRSRIKKPDGYSVAKIKQIVTDAESQASGEGPVNNAEETEKIQPTKIIVIMNEAFSDLAVNGDVVTNEPYMPYYDSLDKNVIKGTSLVSVLGGGTCNSEYEMLTGNSIWFTPAIMPYMSVLQNGHPTLVSTLESQGYTSLAYHPFWGNCWKRENVYRYFGFDDYTFLDGMEGDERAEYIRVFISDESLYRMIEDTVVEAGDEKQFIFAVTMQNHGSYDYEPFDAAIDCENIDSDNLDQYLSLIKASDDALEQLTTFFEDYEEPTMILMFGDHQPGLPAEAWEQITGKTDAEMTDDDRRAQYQTPFIIWTNYDMEARTDVITSTNYLSSMLLEEAGLAMPAYNQFLLQMRETMPAMNLFGYYDSEYVFHPFSDAGETEQAYLQDYRYLMYNQLQGIKKMEQDAFFLPED